MNSRQPSRSTSIAALALAAASLSGFGAASPTLAVSGGFTVNGVQQPLQFAWTDPVSVSGSGWASNARVEIFLHGPLNSPDVAPARLRAAATPAPGIVNGRTSSARLTSRFSVRITDVPLGTVTADAQGAFSASLAIPYDSGVTGSAVRIPRPGYYEVRASDGASSALAASRINLAPATYTGAPPSIDWGHERGGRDGVLPGVFKQFSPERFDPEWPTVWDELPVQAYGTITPTGDSGPDQPALISPSDNPPTHYAHDATFFLVPDPAYRWLIGTSNYYAGDPGSPELGRIELEWETLNGGSTSKYAQGNIGLPLWANPTAGDRVYVVGRWILDAGHPEVGDRTEIHPPRLIATMRKRPALALNGASAAQVDLYVSGHGGGANSMPPGLSAVLDLHGRGGGRLRDLLSPADQTRYYQPGPLAPALAPLVNALVLAITGESISLPILSEAGPSAFPWGNPGAEERPVNDMDYDFDVPLPPAPSATASPAIDVITQPQHTTAVTELVTFTGPPNAAPDTAHVHLPYRGADNGIYARTLRFYWRTAPAPSAHAVVRLTRINVKDTAGKWQLWADISGQWTYLSGLAPALLNTTAGQSVTFPANQTDVYLGSADTVRVYVQGYSAACLDDWFGKLFGMSSYQAGLTFLAACGPTDNTQLGGAVIEIPLQPAPQSTYTLNAKDDNGATHFTVDFSLDIR